MTTNDYILALKWYLHTVFLQSDATGTILLLLFILVWHLLFCWEASRQLNKVHVGDTARPDRRSSTYSLSVLLSAVETSLGTQTALEIAQLVSAAIIYSCSCTTYTSHGYYSRPAFISLSATNDIMNSLFITTIHVLYMCCTCLYVYTPQDGHS